MNWSRESRFALGLSAGLAAIGCAQIAGLTSDYRAADGGNGGTSANAGSIGMNGGGAGASGGTAESGGAAGTSSSGGRGGKGGSGPSGGAAGSTEHLGGTSSTGGVAGSGVAGSGVAGSGVAGNGGSPQGPVPIGYSQFHDSAAGPDNASSHLAHATFAKPPGTAKGDFMLVFFGADHQLNNLTGATLSPRGWTLLDQHTAVGTDGQGTYLIYKFASATEPDTIVFSDINDVPSGDGVQGLLSVYRGVNATAPVNAYEVSLVVTAQRGITQGSTPTPAITTTAANCLLIAGLSPDSAIDAPVITSWPVGFAENQVSVINPKNPYPNGWANIYSAERHLAAAGVVASSAFAWKLSNSTEWYGSLAFVLALAPSP